MKTVYKRKMIGLFLALVLVLNSSAFALDTSGVTVPLLKTEWGQRIDRLQFSPNREGGSCVPVALAQILYSLDIPVQGSKSYSTSKGIYWRDFDANPTQYSSLPLSFDDDKATDAQMKEYDNFLYNCAIVMNHAWENAEIHQEGFSKRVKAHIPVEVETFYYGYSNHTNLTEQEFQDKIIECLRAKQPVMYSIYSSDKVLSHAVVIDAARTSDSKFQVHINFGWNGTCDGWYDLWSPILIKDSTMDGGYRRYDSDERQLTVLTPLTGAAKTAWKAEKLSAEQIRKIQNETRKVPEIENGTLYIPEGTSYLYYDDFKYNKQIKKIVFPSTFKGTTKDTNLFEGCVNLKEVEFGEAMERLSENTFLNCTRLEKIIYGGKWTDDAYTDAFTGCSKLTTAVFTSTCQVIPSGMFWKVKSVKDVTIEEGVEAINYGAFYDTSIERIVIPSTVKEIDSYAFYKTSLKEVYVPASVEKLGDTVFSKSVKIICDEGSAAEEWAKKNGYKYELRLVPADAVSEADVTEVYAEPFLKTQWGQRTDRLQSSPNREGARCDQVALAQILYYLGLPIEGSMSYATSMNVYWRDFDANPTQYSTLPLTYDDEKATDAQMKGLDNFLYNCAIMLNQPWENAEVNADGFSKRVVAHVPADVERFYYGYAKQTNLTEQEFQDKIIECLRAKKPVIYSIHSDDGVYSHAVVIDGARLAADRFQVHLNFGWNGLCDGWYDLWSPILIEDYTEVDGYRKYDSDERQLTVLTPLTGAAKTAWKPFRLTSEQIKNIQKETRKVPAVVNGTLYIPEGTVYLSVDYKEDLSIKKIVFPSTFKGNASTSFTFEGCSNIKELEFSKANEYIIGKTFLDCTGLEKVTYNGEWTDRNFTDAFKGCTSLTTAVFTSSCKVVPSHIFRNVASLTDVTLSEGIEEIGYGAFWNCSKLTNFTIPSTVKEIGGYAFYNIGLKEVYVPSTVETIGDNAFSKSVKIICEEGSAAEAWAKEKGYKTEIKLAPTMVTSNAGVTEVYSEPFITTKWGQLGGNNRFTNGERSGCECAAEATIAQYWGLVPKGSHAYATSKNTYYVDFDAYTPDLRKFPQGYSSDLSEQAKYDAETFLWYHIIIDEKRLDDSTSYHYGGGQMPRIAEHLPYKLTSMTTNENTKEEMEEMIIRNMKAKRPLRIYSYNEDKSSTHVWVIDGARKRNGKLEVHYDFGWYGKDNGWYVFWEPIVNSTISYASDYRALREYIPLTGAELAAWKPHRLTDEQVEKIKAEKRKVPEVINNTLYIPECTGAIASEQYMNRKDFKNISLPYSLRAIYARAFKDCTNLETIVIPPYVEEIGSNAFAGCTKLKTISLPASVKSIANNAIPANVTIVCPENSYVEQWGYDNGFMMANEYTITNGKLTFNSKVKKIRAEMFKGNKEIREVVIGENVVKIGNSAFEGCSNLKKIQFNAINVEMNNSSSVNTFKDCPVEEIVFGPKVTVVPKQTFRNLNSLKFVIIPGNVKEVQQSAFYGDKAIEEIVIEEGVETLVQYCFYGLPLKKITLPSTIKSIEANALPKSAVVICPPNSYAEDFALQNGNEVPSAFNLSNGVLTIKEGIKSIPDEKYMGNTEIREVVIPSTITKIGGSAFKNCTNLTKVTYKATSCTSAGSGGNNVTAAFVGCTKLSQLIIADGVTILPANIFRECAALKQVTFPSSLKKINSSAFYKSGLEEVVIPEGVEEILSSAFGGITNLKKVALSSSLTSIANNAFPKTAKIVCPAGSYAESWALANGFTIEGRNSSANNGSSSSTTAATNSTSTSTANNSSSSTISSSTANSSSSGSTSSSTANNSSNASTSNAEYTIKNGVLTFSSTVTAIEASKFKGNAEIREVVIGENITKIGNSAFEGCPNLKKIQFNAKNVEMNNSSSVNIFKNCPVEELVFGPKVEVVPRQTFRNLNSLKSVRIPGNVKEVQMSAFYGDKAIEEIVIEEGVETLVEYCFYGLPLKKITLPATIKSIEANALPKSATVICPSDSYAEKYAIQNGNDVPGAFALSNGVLTIKEGIKSIPDGMYTGNSEIREVIIPSTVTKIGADAFKNCTNLTKVTYKATSCTNAGTSVTAAFLGCTNLSKVIIAEGVTTIPANIFRECPALKQISFPSSLKTINSSAFYKTSLEEIVIPQGVETIAYTVFSSNSNLKTVRFSASVKSIQNNAFDKKNVKFYAPKGSYAEQWCKDQKVDYTAE
ncbi:MAG: leucine-rich repeat protein [Treponemataceae bacterium]|nr:leucine-rich repeat protein [Treponemataceae bacterium]